MDNPEIWIALIIVGFLFFGAKRMPDAARGLGRSLRIFKAETKGLMGDDATVTSIAVVAPDLVYAQAAPTPAPVVAQASVVPAPVAAPAPVAPAPVAE